MSSWGTRWGRAWGAAWGALTGAVNTNSPAYPGSYTLTGLSATGDLVRLGTGAAYPGSYIVTGQDISVLHVRVKDFGRTRVMQNYPAHRVQFKESTSVVRTV